MSSSLFSRATKAQAKARIAFSGPSGAGKTYWALQMATALVAETGGKIALIDTERSSASLYADKFEFDTLSMSPPYHPDRLVEVLKVAKDEGYEVIVVDSLTHFWNGKGGVLEIVEDAKSRVGGNQFQAWAVGTPIYQAMLDAILAYDGHIITTMRAKTEYSMEKNGAGKTEIRKLGMAPIMRDGIEYEFTLTLDVDIDHRASVSKTRCVSLADRSFKPVDSGDMFSTFLNWLSAGDPLLDNNQRNALETRIGNLTPASRDALKKAWSQNNLPKVAQLTATQLAKVTELLGSVETIEGEDAPDSEVVPS
jgi:energy-coupling factor transporter ATP-binding protein EcfA2